MSNSELVGQIYEAQGVRHQIIAEDESDPNLVLTENLKTGDLGTQNADILRVLLRQAAMKDGNG